MSATTTTAPLSGFDASIQTGLAGFRWAAWVWNATVLLLARGKLVHPEVAWLLVATALVVTVAATVLARRRSAVLSGHAFVSFELAVAFGLQLADGYVYGPTHVFSSEPALGVAWPLAAVLAAGIAWGARGGLVGGVVVGVGRVISTLVALGQPIALDIAMVDSFDGAQQISLVTTIFLYTLAGTAAGLVVTSLRQAEMEVATARAREEVARTLHDGVLQTLALVERRSDDPALARLAREQEVELRAYLFGAGGAPVVGRGDVGDALRAAASRFERHHGGRVEVLVPDDLPDLDAAHIEALAGAVGEALTNAGKHGRATRVTVYVEPDGAGGLFCSVKDNGGGFDPDATTEGVGWTRSIRGRMAEVGGRADVVSAPGRGAEVRLSVPGR